MTAAAFFAIIEEADGPGPAAKTGRPDAAPGRLFRTDKTFFVPKDEIVGNDYDLSINKYKQTEYEAVEYPPTVEIMTKLDEIEMEIGPEMEALRNLLGL